MLFCERDADAFFFISNLCCGGRAVKLNLCVCVINDYEHKQIPVMVISKQHYVVVDGIAYVRRCICDC